MKFEDIGLGLVKMAYYRGIMVFRMPKLDNVGNCVGYHYGLSPDNVKYSRTRIVRAIRGYGFVKTHFDDLSVCDDIEEDE